MEDVELLVHISAPARRQDDQRFLDIAQSVIDFEPVTLTDGTDAQTSAAHEIGQDSFINDQLLSKVDDDGNCSPTPGAASALRSMSRQGAEKLFNGNTDKATRKASSENTNPPYKNPYHGPPVTEKTRFLYETPHQSRRPRTAPEQLPTSVQVPRTGANLRRAYSDSASFSSFASHISNSQPSGRRELEGDEASTAIPSSSWLRGGDVDFHGGITRTLSQTSLDEAQLPQKRRKLFAEHEAGVKRIPRPANSEAFLLLDRSLNWTSSPLTSQLNSSSVSSTATPSQPMHDQYTNMEGPQSTPPPVILISSESSKQAEARSSHGPSISSSSAPQIFEQTSDASDVPKRGSQLTADRPSLFQVLGLKCNVSAPQPSVSEERFATHVTTPLRDFAEQLPFTRFFRPIEVTRDIGVLERGYWLLEINIVAEETAEAARSAEKDKKQGETMQERFQGATAAERLRKYDDAKRDGTLYQSGQSAESKAQGLWTEDELIQFWKSFSSFIENGKAGWGTRLVGEEVSSKPGEVKVRIRVFTWGEVLGHVYLAIWVLSDKLTARIPMHWVASDGSHVIRMSGTRSGRGSLPLWTRKGPEGEKGCWGITPDVQIGD